VTWRAGTDTARGREFGEERKLLMKAVSPRMLGTALAWLAGNGSAAAARARAQDGAEFSAGFAAPFHDLPRSATICARCLPSSPCSTNMSR